MKLQPSIALMLTVVSLSLSGCCWRGESPSKCCPPFVSGRTPLAVSLKSADAGVAANFDSLPAYDSIRQSVLAQVAADGTVAISLEEAICLAARNSQLAEVIDEERHLLQCQSDDACQTAAIDMVLQGEALEQRNKAAGAAGELFLNLVQVSMQLDLIDQSQQHLADLETRINAADDAGFATAQGRNEVEKGRLKVKRLQSEIDSVLQQLTFQLNLLLSPDENSMIVFRPVYQLNPTAPLTDLKSSIAIAEANRPGILAAQSAIASGGSLNASYQLLKLMDNRLGVKLDSKPLRKQLLRQQLIENLRLAEQPDPTAAHRRQQAAKIVAARKREAAVETGKAILDMQTAFEKLTLIQEDIDRLKRQAKVIEASKEIDAKDVYLRENENWVELQQAKSDRVSAAIEYESAKVRLQQAQGTLIQGCGYRLEGGCSTLCQ